MESQIVRRLLQSFIPCLFSLLVAVKLKPEIISQGDRELIVNMTILDTWDETWASYLKPSLIRFKSLPKRLIKTQERVNTFHCFISKLIEYSGSLCISTVQWNLDWGNLFVKSRVCYIKHLHIKNFQENYQNVHSIELYIVNYTIITFQ